MELSCALFLGDFTSGKSAVLGGGGWCPGPPRAQIYLQAQSLPGTALLPTAEQEREQSRGLMGGGAEIPQQTEISINTQTICGPRIAVAALLTLANPCELAAARHHHQLGFIVAFLSFVCLEYPVCPPFSGR